MSKNRSQYTCLECNDIIDYQVFKYSTKNKGIPLCRFHQAWIEEMEFQSTEETITLYFSLKERDVPAVLEKFDGYKTIDIAVPASKVNIEVDGQHHNFNPSQALSDLKRTYYAFKKGYLTLRIPNSLVRNHLEETADMITDFLNENNQRY
jgi:hypothetical protein